MTMELVDDRQQSRFELRVDGETAGLLTYERTAGGVSLLELTTDLRRAGQGLGVVLVRKALDAVSAEGLPVLPVSSFVRDFIRRHPVYLDLVPADQRDRFGLPIEDGPR
jgi:predicted GNAT family acetyltransferase